ncbi:MAG: VWA domain-containing protein [Opitutaceae bacterium]|nr:VWA domain-containing protein [Opitutaceae bacterium]
MTFLWPHFLWLLAIPAAAMLPFWRRPTSSDEQNHPRIHRATTAKGVIELEGRSKTYAGSRFGLLWVALALGIVALARPQWGDVDEPTFSTSREIILALDLSRSMNANDVPPSRLERARLLTRNLLDSLKGERVGLVVFAGKAFLQSPLSADYEILGEFLPDLKPGFLPEGGTNYDSLLETSLEAFSAEGGAQRFLVVLSDGEATDDLWLGRVPELKKRAVKVIGVGIGTEQGAMIPDGAGSFVKDRFGAVVLSRLEPRTLQQLAEGTGGIYASGASWVEVPQLIRQTVESAEKGKFKETVRRRKVDRFQWFLAPAFFLVLASLAWEFAPPPPAARNLKRKASTPAGVVARAASLLVLGLLLGGLPSPVKAQSAPSPTGDPAAAPLVALSRNLSRQDQVEAKDWERYARMTLDYARRRADSKGIVSTQAIRDALAAVATGEAQAPAAAPWQELRDKLEVYLTPSPTPTPPPSPTPPPEQQQQQQQQQQQPSPPPQGGQQPSPPPPGGEEKRPPQKSETQKVGGSPKRATPTPGDPRLTAPQQKLDQLKGQDKPMEFHKQLNRDQDNREVDKDW